MRRDELVKEIQIPELPRGSKGAYLKLSARRRMDPAIVDVGDVVAVADGIFRDAC